ncbi:hypothetical protein RhiJN_14596 [Ceratobasidium sp. AG-Ba]|nr:hypothetical protein RhiJN_14596 [Ceratobasidium sp. AG-Ba]
MSQPPLHPLALGPIPAGDLFECRGEGLLYQGVKRESRAGLKELLDPFYPPMYSPPKGQMKKTKLWWKAQCLHYGVSIPRGDKVEDYRNCLKKALGRPGGLRRPRNFVELEHEYNAVFRWMNADVRDAVMKSRKRQFQRTSDTTGPRDEAGLDLVVPGTTIIPLERGHAMKRKAYEQEDGFQETLRLPQAAGHQRPTKQLRAANALAGSDRFDINKAETRRLLPTPPANMIVPNPSVPASGSVTGSFGKQFMVCIPGLVKILFGYRSREQQNSHGRNIVQESYAGIETPFGVIELKWLSGTAERVEANAGGHGFGRLTYDDERSRA